MIMCVEHWILIQGRFAVVRVSFKRRWTRNIDNLQDLTYKERFGKEGL